MKKKGKKKVDYVVACKKLKNIPQSLCEKICIPPDVLTGV